MAFALHQHVCVNFITYSQLIVADDNKYSVSFELRYSCFIYHRHFHLYNIKISTLYFFIFLLSNNKVDVSDQGCLFWPNSDRHRQKHVAEQAMITAIVNNARVSHQGHRP